MRTQATALPYFFKIRHAPMLYSFYVSLGITGSDTLPPLLMDGKRHKKSPNRGIRRGGGEGEEDDYNDLLCLLGFMFSGRKYTAGCAGEKNAHFHEFWENTLRQCRVSALKEICKNTRVKCGVLKCVFKLKTVALGPLKAVIEKTFRLYKLFQIFVRKRLRKTS
jgi:hypothetical protein